MNNYFLLHFENQKKNFICLFSFLILSLPTAVFAQSTIEVFVDQPLIAPSIPNAVIMVFDLSRVGALEEDTPDFPPDPVLAQAQAQAWLESSAGKIHLLKVKAAYAGQEKMMLYGVQKIPAIVFNEGKFVVYGTTDIPQAVRDYDYYRRTHSQTTGAGNDLQK